jgi:hemerythrin
MDLFVWMDEYNIGHSEIDKQHQLFIDLINRLHKELADIEDYKDRADLLKELESYAVFHFISEENIIKKLKLSGRKQHHDLHKQLNFRLRELITPVLEGYSPAEDVLKFVGSWLIKHTLEEDKKLFSVNSDIS